MNSNRRSRGSARSELTVFDREFYSGHGSNVPVSKYAPVSETPEEILNATGVLNAGKEILSLTSQALAQGSEILNSPAGDPNSSQATQNQPAEAHDTSDQNNAAVIPKFEYDSYNTNSLGNSELNNNLFYYYTSPGPPTCMDRTFHLHGPPPVPELSTLCEDGCICPKCNDVSNFVKNFCTEGPLFVKELNMPITLVSLGERVIPRSHQPCCVCVKLYPTFQCCGCYQVSYCSVEHQAQHWKIHKPYCTPRVRNEMRGLEHVGISPITVAVTDLDANFVVSKIQPVVVAPINRGGGNRHSIHNSLCLGCCRWFSLDATNVSKCANCSWPVCSIECQNNSRHAEYECTIFKKNDIPLNHSPWAYDAILALRCLMLKEKDPASFDQLTVLQNLAQIRDRSPEAFREDQNIAQFLITDCKVDVEFSMDRNFLLMFLKIVESCSLTMPEYPMSWVEEEKISDSPKPKEKKKYNSKTHRTNDKKIDVTKRPVSVRFVILTKHNFSQNCSPNTRWILHYDQKRYECYLKITTTVPIEGGREIDVCWNTDSEFGTIARRRMSTMRFGSSCLCDRCMDETENGSNFGTFLCEKCAVTPDPDSKDKPKMKVGLVRSKYPLDDMSEHYKYRCTTKGCTFQISRNEVLARLGTILPKVEAVKDTVAGLVDVMDRFSGRLHPNHYIMVRAKHYIISNIVHQVHMSQFDDVPMTTLEFGGKLIDECLAVHELITPGTSLIRGRLLFQRIMVAGVYTVRQAERYCVLGMTNDLIQCSENLMCLKDTQLEAYNILKDDPKGTFNQDCAMKLKKLLEEFDEIVYYRRLGEPLPFDLIRRLRMALARLTSDLEMPYAEFLEDPELFLFKMTAYDTPPEPPMPPRPRQHVQAHGHGHGHGHGHHGRRH